MLNALDDDPPQINQKQMEEIDRKKREIEEQNNQIQAEQVKLAQVKKSVQNDIETLQQERIRMAEERQMMLKQRQQTVNRQAQPAPTQSYSQAPQHPQFQQQFAPSKMTAKQQMDNRANMPRKMAAGGLIPRSSNKKKKKQTVKEESEEDDDLSSSLSSISSIDVKSKKKGKTVTMSNLSDISSNLSESDIDNLIQATVRSEDMSTNTKKKKKGGSLVL
jgi:hypothetical protein